MTASTPLVVRFLLDAQDQFVRTIDHIPAPGRGGPWGRLNAAGWVVAHAAMTHDTWINVLVGGAPREPWVAGWNERQTAATLAHPITTPIDEAHAAFLAVAEHATQLLAGYDTRALERRVETPRGAVAAGYLVARAPAHLLAHAGELSVIASLAGAGDLGLPGPLERSSEQGVEAAAEDGTPLVARLLLDARAEVERVADALPAPARHGAIARVNSGAWTIAHLANQEDAVWNAAAQGGTRDAWCATAYDGNEPRSGQPFEDALDAFRRVTAGSTAFIEALRAAELARPIDAGIRGRTLGAQVVRSTGHLFAHAGELVAIGSLFGMPDLGLPGTLAHTAGVATVGR